MYFIKYFRDIGGCTARVYRFFLCQSGFFHAAWAATPIGDSKLTLYNEAAGLGNPKCLWSKTIRFDLWLYLPFSGWPSGASWTHLQCPLSFRCRPLWCLGFFKETVAAFWNSRSCSSWQEGRGRCRRRRCSGRGSSRSCCHRALGIAGRAGVASLLGGGVIEVIGRSLVSTTSTSVQAKAMQKHHIYVVFPTNRKWHSGHRILEFHDTLIRMFHNYVCPIFEALPRPPRPPPDIRQNRKNMGLHRSCSYNDQIVRWAHEPHVIISISQCKI